MAQPSTVQSYEDYLKNGPDKVEKQGNHFYDPDSHEALGMTEFISMYNELRENGYNHSDAWKKMLKTIPLTGHRQLMMLNWIKLKDEDFYSRASSEKKVIISSSVFQHLKHNSD